LINFLTIN